MNKQQVKIEKTKQVIGTNIHTMELYLNINKLTTHKRMMKKTIEQLETMYEELVPIYQKQVKKNYIDFQLAEEFDMEDYDDGDNEFDFIVDAKKSILESEQEVYYFGLYWQVIFTIDIYHDSRMGLNQVNPDSIKQKRYWYITETKAEEDNVKLHRKYVADTITTEQLITFLKEVDFTDTCGTMGALTMFGHLPATNFSIYSDIDSMNAYVSPLMLDDTINKLYIKYDKDNFKSNEAIEMRRLIQKANDDILEILENSVDGFVIPNTIKIPKPMSLPFK